MKDERYFESQKAKFLWEIKQHVRRAFSSDWGLAISTADMNSGKVIPVNHHLICEVGFKHTIVLSSSLYKKYIKPYKGQKSAEADFLTDMLWLLRLKTAGCNAGKIKFKAVFKTSNGKQKDISMNVAIGPSEKIEVGPVMKIMLLWEE